MLPIPSKSINGDSMRPCRCGYTFPDIKILAGDRQVTEPEIMVIVFCPMCGKPYERAHLAKKGKK